MKRILAFLLAAALALTLAACGNKGTAQSGGEVKNASGTLVFSDSGITADGTGYQVDGTAVTITSTGVYALSGSCRDGSVTVDKGVTGVTLVLNGLSLCGGDTAAITCGKGSAVTIQAAEGSVNTLSDTEQNNDDSYPANENAENAVIKCKDGTQVTLCGSGSLTIDAQGKNGIKSGATTDEEGQAWLVIRELTLTIDAPVNDAVNAEQSLTVESGTLTISAGDDALHSDLALTIGAEGADGPSITISDCYEGLEGANLAVCSGNIAITARDDCLNAANGDLSGYAFTMDISGGTIWAYTSQGDGFDSNGSMTISGGTVTVWSAGTADNQPLDADGAMTISGGTVLAAGGSSGMGMNLEAQQPCVTFSGVSVAKGTALTIGDVYSGQAVCDARFVFFSSPDLTAEESYALTAGGSQLASAAAQTGTVSSFTGGGPGGMGGQMPGGQQPGGQQPGGDPPQLPDGQTPGGDPPEMPDGQQPGGQGDRPTPPDQPQN